MNLVSNHNRLLRGAAIPTAGGDVYNSGWEYTPEGEISGYSGSAIYQQDCPCDSAAIVDSAFDKSTAWVEEQNYLTAHQDVSNLPYVQNSSLEFNGALISGISGSGFYAVSADNANYADLANSASESERAISATVSQEAVHAGSADYANNSFYADSAYIAEGANHAESADSAYNAEISNVSYTALTANFLDGGWEHDEDGFITAYNNSAFAGNGHGGGLYFGVEPIVVNNDEMKISARSAVLGVQDPLYFVEDSQTATVIGIHDSAFPEFSGTEDGQVSSINGSAIYASNVPEYSAGSNIDITNHVISVTGSVPSADRAAYAVSATSAHFSHSAIEAGSADSANYATESNHTHSADSATYDSLGRKIVDTYLTAHQPLPDWTPTIQNASGNAYNSAVNWVVDQHYLTSHQDVSDLPYVQNTALESNGILISGISGSGLYATSADNAFEADHAYEADYVVSGWEYDEENRISGYKGSAFAGQGGQGIEYEGIAPIVVNNVEHKISAQSAKLGVQEPLYFVEDSTTATVIGISGLPEVEGVMYESGLGTSDNKITGYNGTAFSAGSTYDVKASANISVATAGTTFTVSGKDWTNTITGASSYAYNQATANATGKYIPYTHISTGDSGTTVYNVPSGIRTTAASGWVEMYPQNKEHKNEAHLQVAQNYTGNKSFWAELDGAGGGFLQLNWNSGTVSPNAHSSYADGTTASMALAIGSLVYRSATHNVTATGEGGDGENKVWQLGSERLRFWNQWGTASFGPRGMDSYDSAGDNHWYTTAVDSATRFRIVGSAGDGTKGALDLTPGYINFYDSNWNLDATINKGQISAWNAVYSTVNGNSGSWTNVITSTGGTTTYIQTINNLNISATKAGSAVSATNAYNLTNTAIKVASATSANYALAVSNGVTSTTAKSIIYTASLPGSPNANTLYLIPE